MELAVLVAALRFVAIVVELDHKARGLVSGRRVRVEGAVGDAREAHALLVLVRGRGTLHRAAHGVDAPGRLEPKHVVATVERRVCAALRDVRVAAVAARRGRVALLANVGALVLAGARRRVCARHKDGAREVVHRHRRRDVVLAAMARAADPLHCGLHVGGAVLGHRPVAAGRAARRKLDEEHVLLTGALRLQLAGARRVADHAQVDALGPERLAAAALERVLGDAKVGKLLRRAVLDGADNVDEAALDRRAVDALRGHVLGGSGVGRLPAAGPHLLRVRQRLPVAREGLVAD